MNLQRCQGCQKWWCYECGLPERFMWITRLCPICVENAPKLGPR